MELKNLLLRLAKTEKPELFLALEIGSGFLKSAIWEIASNKTKINRFGSIEEFNPEDEADFINAVDSSFTQAIEGLPTLPSGVIFGLPENWLSGETVSGDKKPLLKIVCEKFNLKPLGFVQSQEALLHFFRLKEGVPLNAILVGLNSSGVWVGLVKNGKVIAEQITGRSDDLGSDVEEGLARLEKMENYPARIILFNGDNINEEMKEQLESYSWEERLPFLHAPKVETLPPLTSIEAIAVAGGAEVARSLGFEIQTESVETINKTEAVVEASVEQQTATPAAELGFVQDKDIVEESTELVSEVDSVSQDQPASKEDRPVAAVKPRFRLSKLKTKISGIKNLIKKPDLGRLKKSGRWPLVLGGGIALVILCLVGLFMFWWHVPKADVILYLEPKVLEEELTVILNPEAKDFDVEQKIIPAEVMTISLEGTKTAPTTGESLVGDPASGEVVVYNKTNLEKVFAAGTVLIGPDKLRFTLDNEIEVASQSATETDEGMVTTYGKTTAAITASSIGTEGNLPGGSEFSFKDYPESVYSAKTEAGLTGGTSRQVKTVSPDDRETLLAELEQELTLRAKEELKQKSAGKTILDENITSEVSNQDFDAQAGDETEDLTLALKIDFKALVFSETVFKSMLMEWLRGTLPDDFVLYPDNLQTEFKEKTITDDLTAQLIVGLKVNLIPELDQAEIKNNLVGRYPPVIQEYLKSLTNFAAVDITIKPSLPARLNTLPHKAENINLQIKVNP